MKGTTGSLWEWFLGQHSRGTGMCSRHFAGRPRIDRPQERDFTPILCFHRSKAILLFFFAVLPVTRSLSCDGASVALASLLDSEVDIRKDLSSRACTTLDELWLLHTLPAMNIGLQTLCEFVRTTLTFSTWSITLPNTLPSPQACDLMSVCAGLSRFTKFP